MNKNILEAKLEPLWEEGRRANVECEAGWYQLISDLTDELLSLDPNMKILQIKEKFGGLRYYISVEEYTPEIQLAISKAEAWSFQTCESCGRPGQLRNRNWMRTLCDECC